MKHTVCKVEHSIYGAATLQQIRHTYTSAIKAQKPWGRTCKLHQNDLGLLIMVMHQTPPTDRTGPGLSSQISSTVTVARGGSCGLWWSGFTPRVSGLLGSVVICRGRMKGWRLLWTFYHQPHHILSLPYQITAGVQAKPHFIGSWVFESPSSTERERLLSLFSSSQHLQATLTPKHRWKGWGVTTAYCYWHLRDFQSSSSSLLAGWTLILDPEAPLLCCFRSCLLWPFVRCLICAASLKCSQGLNGAADLPQ